MSDIPEKQVASEQQPPEYRAPNIVNVVPQAPQAPQGQSAAIIAQEYRDQCKSLPYRLELIF